MGDMLRSPEHNIPRVHCDDLSVEDFLEKYQKPNKPVIIEGLAEGWPAMQKWNFKQLYQDYGEVEFEVGEDEIGTPVTMQFKDFIHYMIFNRDDAPLYLFQRDLHNKPGMQDLMKDYEIPKYFKEDFQQIMDDKYKPNYNWFLVGPRRSGSYIHYDPFSMSAWNTSLYGHKKWILLEPRTDRDFAEGFSYRTEENLDNFDAMNHVINLYPQMLKSDEIKTRYEFIQKRGDTIFLP